MRSLLRLTFTVSITALLSLSINATELDSIGSFDFPTSGSPEAHAHFTLGVGYLHSFGWKQVQEEFKKAQAIEPDFALATALYTDLLSLWNDDSLAAVQEARRYLASNR